MAIELDTSGVSDCFQCKTAAETRGLLIVKLSVFKDDYGAVIVVKAQPEGSQRPSCKVGLRKKNRLMGSPTGYISIQQVDAEALAS